MSIPSYKSYKINDPRGKQSSDTFLHALEIETERLQFQDVFVEAPAALASTIYSKAHWTGGGTNGTQSIVAGGLMQLSTGALASSTSTLDFTNAAFPNSLQPSMEIRLTTDALTNRKIEFGFYASANDYLLFRFDTGSSLDTSNFIIASKNNGGAEVAMSTLIPPVAGTYNKFRIDIFSDSTFRLYVDNKLIINFTGTIQSGLTTLKPHFYIDNKAVAQNNNLNIDYVKFSEDGD